MKRILRFKHWQLFLLIIITSAWTSPSPLKEIINSISFVTMTIWLYAIGFYGQEKLRETNLPTLSLKLFKTNIIIMPILLIIIICLLPEQTGEDVETEFTWQTIMLIPVVLYFFFAAFQTTIFACKTLSTIELKREVKFNDYALNLILILFFIVGIWILQPKVTRLIASDDVK
jgi:hypothetical protein